MSGRGQPIKSRYTPLLGGLRKEPAQARSKAAIRKVLDVAAELIVEHGTDALIGSPAMLLERSDISRGSFYAFFGSPERVLDELVLRCMQESQDELMELFACRPRIDWMEIIDLLLDQYWRRYEIPLIREIWVGHQLSANSRILDQMWVQKLGAVLLSEFLCHRPKFDKLTFTQCVVAVEILERLAEYAFRDDAKGDATVWEQARVLLHAYFQSVSSKADLV